MTDRARWTSSAICAAAAAVFGIGAPFARAQVDFESRPLFERDQFASWTAGDVDGDGHLDVIVLDSDGVAVYWGDGAAAFVAGPESVLPQEQRFDGTAVDVTGDGILDLVSRSEGRCQSLPPPPDDLGAIEILRGSASGQFQSFQSIPISETLEEFAVADFDGDEAVDIAVMILAGFEGCGGPHSLRVMLNDGNGGFPPARQIAFSFGLPVVLADLLVADFNEDGVPDVALLDGAALDASVGIVLGIGDGTFTPVTWYSTERCSASAFRATDVDFDGHVDVLVQAIPGCVGDVRILRGTGTGSLFDAYGAPTSFFPEYLVDVDSDGDQDGIIVDDYTAGTDSIRVALCDSAGGFGPPRVFGPGVGCCALVAGDFDEDGLPDLLLQRTPTLRHTVILVNVTDELTEIACRAGTVAGAGHDVMFVNGSSGLGPARRLRVDRFAPFRIDMAASPGDPQSAFALFAWIGAPDPGSVVAAPGTTGSIGMRPPFAGGAPKKTWNNLGNEPAYGAPNLPSTAAPSVVIERPRLPKRARFYLQGIIEDSSAPEGLAVTNGIEVTAR